MSYDKGRPTTEPTPTKYDKGSPTLPRFVRPNVVACDSWRGQEKSYIQDLNNRTCSCPDFVHRRAARGELCKHLTLILTGEIQ